MQGLAIILQRAWAGQYHLGLGQQTGERGAQLVGDVGGERREALEGFFQARQHGVQLAGQSAQLLWHPAGVEAGGEEFAETRAATSRIRRSGARLAPVAQAPSSAVASADRLMVSQINWRMRCRKCW